MAIQCVPGLKMPTSSSSIAVWLLSDLIVETWCSSVLSCSHFQSLSSFDSSYLPLFAMKFVY